MNASPLSTPADGLGPRAAAGDTAAVASLLRRLPLQDLHVAHGARLQPFAGVAMPIHYSSGILEEHRHTRSAAGLFDVSHMGQFLVRARSGNTVDAARALEALVPADVLSLPAGRQRYALFTSASGGILDDLMIANLGSCHYLVVNAACAKADLEHLTTHLSALCTIEALSERALLALQGPAAGEALSRLLPSVAGMRFMDAGICSLHGVECFVTRCGYTGEDGFEISLPASSARQLAESLLAHSAVQLVGLGARDSLRLEAGLCLYGHDLTVDTSPVEAALDWAIAPVRRAGAARAGGFPGADVVLRQLDHGVSRRRIGLRSEHRPVRGGAALFADAVSSEVLGHVTSGTFGPSVPGPVAMGYVPAAAARTGTRLCADVRGQRTPVVVADLPFVPHRYHR